MKNLKKNCMGDCESCGKCIGANLIRESDLGKLNKSFMPKGFIGDKREKFGIAFDIGTTTVAGNLWDLEKGISLQILGATNPQNRYGADVISRISFCEDDPEKFLLIRNAIINCLNKMIEELLENNGLICGDVIRVTVAGNTAMSHIFAGFNPKNLSFAPFQPSYEGPMVLEACQLGLKLNPGTKVILLPNIAGHIGGDVTGGILATRLEEMEGITLFLDIGTNGEIVLKKEDQIMACSTAAGPAFEGASIYQGMRAVAGAIEKIQLKEGTVFFKTVENVEPIGICGSGVIQAIGEMLKMGLINKSGRLLLPHEIGDQTVSEGLKARVREGRKGREFVLVFKENKEDLVITQLDIREVQLAKGAIYAGIVLMLAELEEQMENIDRIIVAGAFGNFIDKESAQRVGLLPNVSLDKIQMVGNAAEAGASLVLLSEEEEGKAIGIAAKIKHLELANCVNFQEEFLKAISF